MIHPRSRTPIRLVAFDLDGTLIDSMQDIASSVNAALTERYGEASRLPIAQVRSFVGSGARYLIEQCLIAVGRPAGEVDSVFERFLPIYASRVTETTLLYAGMREALAVVGGHAKLAVLTNKPGDMSRTLVRALDLDGRFIDVIGGDDLKTRKPDPEGLLKLCARAGVRPEEAALVGDSAVDVRTAKNAGALSIGALWGYDREGVEREGPDVAIAHPAELSRLCA